MLFLRFYQFLYDQCVCTDLCLRIRNETLDTRTQTNWCAMGPSLHLHRLFFNGLSLLSLLSLLVNFFLCQSTERVPDWGQCKYLAIIPFRLDLIDIVYTMNRSAHTAFNGRIGESCATVLLCCQKGTTVYIFPPTSIIVPTHPPFYFLNLILNC